jgi:hypothetical protein
MRTRSGLIIFLTLGIILLLTGAISAPKAAAAVTCPSGGFYFYHAGNGLNGPVLDANGWSPPSWTIVWPEKPNDGSANNQLWCEQAGSANGTQGYFIWAYYSGQKVCLDVSGANFSSGAHILAYPCNWHYNELFHFAVVGSNAYNISPAYYPAENFLCLNVSGGIANGHHIILYACDTSANNERWSPQLGL